MSHNNPEMLWTNNGEHLANERWYMVTMFWINCLNMTHISAYILIQFSSVLCCSNDPQSFVFPGERSHGLILAGKIREKQADKLSLAWELCYSTMSSQRKEQPGPLLKNGWIQFQLKFYIHILPRKISHVTSVNIYYKGLIHLNVVD